MNSSFSLGRIAGVQIGINWSWLVVFALIVWTMSENVFPAENPGLGDGTYFAMAVVAAILFFASILLHELGHAIQARRDGMEIDGITLWLFGGVARFKGMFPSAAAELRIALAGPAVSLMLGGLFVGLAALVPIAQSVDAVAAWVGRINLILLIFNLIPALPLDGGRVLRALVWLRSGDFGKATRIAAAGGRGFGYLLIGVGIALAVAWSDVSGLWLAFIGWFLLGAANAELRMAQATGALAGVVVRDLMVREPPVAQVGTTIGRFVDGARWPERDAAYPVVDDHGTPVGLLPMGSVADVPREEWDAQSVGDVMVSLADVPVVSEQTSASDALVAIGPSEARAAFVVEGGYIVGLISAADLVRALQANGSTKAEPW
jgi:Zn-dependent protease